VSWSAAGASDTVPGQLVVEAVAGGRGSTTGASPSQVDGAALLVFFVAPALTIALCVGVAALLRRVVPDVYAVLTGGRTGRRAPALPPAAPVVQPEQTAEPRSRSEPSTAPGAAPVTSGLGKRLEGA